MSQNQTVSIMLFVLSLFLIAVGIGLSTVAQRVTAYETVGFFRVPYQTTIYPYNGVSVFMVSIGIIVLVVAFIKARSKTNRKKTVLMRDIDIIGH